MLQVFAIIAFLIACYGIVILVYKMLAKRKGSNITDCSYDILCEIKSNNTYPPMLDVFTSLSENLAECKIELHADLRGYLDYGKTQ